MTMLKPLALATLLTALSVVVPSAQTKTQKQVHKTVTRESAVTSTFTIAAIDQNNPRSLTLRSADGDEDTYAVAPQARLKQFKVGQKVSVTYYKALLLQLRKTGEPSATTGESGGIKEAAGGGTRLTRTVTVKAVDVNAPSITVVTEDGRTITRMVAHRKNLEDVNPGDRIDITYTQALVVKAIAAK
jgi:hypothetical protein